MVADTPRSERRPAFIVSTADKTPDEIKDIAAQAFKKFENAEKDAKKSTKKK